MQRVWQRVSVSDGYSGVLQNFYIIEAVSPCGAQVTLDDFLPNLKSYLVV